MRILSVNHKGLKPSKTTSSLQTEGVHVNRRRFFNVFELTLLSVALFPNTRQGRPTKITEDMMQIVEEQKLLAVNNEAIAYKTIAYQ